MRLEDRGRNIWATVTADMQRYVGRDCRAWSPRFLKRLARQAYASPGLIAVLVYRYGQWVTFRCRVPIVRQVCDAYYYSLYNWVRTRLQIEVPRTTTIDAGLRIDHFGSIIINSQVCIGRNLTVTHGVVLGQTDTGVPTIGDNVDIGTGAKVLGGIRVGSDVVIGAQSVVIHDVPDGVVVAGVPAKIVRHGTPRGRVGSTDEEDRVRDPAH